MVYLPNVRGGARLQTHLASTFLGPGCCSSKQVGNGQQPGPQAQDLPQHTNVVVGATTSRGHNAVVHVNHLDELADDKWDGLDSLDLLL